MTIITEEVDNAEHTTSTDAGFPGGNGSEGLAESPEGGAEDEALAEAAGEDEPGRVDDLDGTVGDQDDVGEPVLEEGAGADTAAGLGSDAPADAGGPVEDLTGGLPACAFEDSDNCYWNAQEAGNGKGDSFTVRDGEVTYWDSPELNPMPGGEPPCYDMVIPGYEGECGVILNTEEIGGAVTEQAETVSETQVLSHPPVLAETGASGPAMGVAAAVFICIGFALIVTKIVKNRKAVA